MHRTGTVRIPLKHAPPFYEIVPPGSYYVLPPVFSAVVVGKGGVLYSYRTRPYCTPCVRMYVRHSLDFGFQLVLRMRHSLDFGFQLVLRMRQSELTTGSSLGYWLTIAWNGVNKYSCHHKKRENKDKENLSYVPPKKDQLLTMQ